MSYKSALVDTVFFVRWQQPERADINRLLREVIQASKARGEPVFYLAVSPEDSPAPDKETRQQMVTVFETLSQHCRAIHLVYEARGFKASIKRNVMTGIVLASRSLRGVRVHKSVSEAFSELGNAVDIPGVQAKLEAAGLLS